jgi:hypothetical protein
LAKLLKRRSAIELEIGHRETDGRKSGASHQSGALAGLGASVC